MLPRRRREHAFPVDNTYQSVRHHNHGTIFLFRGREGHHLPESDVEVNSAWSCTSVRPIVLKDVPRHQSILYRGTKVDVGDNVIGMVTRL